jgi:FkbM family methyltransferase
MNEIYKSETGLDKWIRENVFTDYEYKGIMIEVGAATPETISNSYHYRINGWRTICIEPNPYFIELHKKSNSEAYQYACSDVDKNEVDFIVVGNETNDSDLNYHSFSHLDTTDILINGEIAEDWKNVYHSSDKKTIKVNVRKLDTILTELNVDRIDILTIDVEGNEMNVLKGFDIVKYNPSIIVIENISRLDIFRELLKEYGYTNIITLGGYDEIYVNDKK